jgi:hypothetical protein
VQQRSGGGEPDDPATDHHHVDPAGGRAHDADPSVWSGV